MDTGLNGGPRIVIIEDDPAFASYLAQRLGQLGYRAEWLKDGARAAARLRHEPADLLLVDLALPGVDGLTLIDELRRGSLLEPTVVVVLTGRLSGADVDRANALGVDEYVVKPFNEAVFFARLAELSAGASRPLLFD